VGGDERAALVLIGVDTFGPEDVQDRVDAGDEFLLQCPARFQPSPGAGEGGTVSRGHGREPAAVAS
jgi:hypothetical protein